MSRSMLTAEDTLLDQAAEVGAASIDNVVVLPGSGITITATADTGSTFLSEIAAKGTGGFFVLAGLALADAMLGRPAVTVCLFGDGAVAEGVFHETLNLAALWQLPVLYACVNNGYAISMPVGKGHASADIVDMALQKK